MPSFRLLPVLLATLGACSTPEAPPPKAPPKAEVKPFVAPTPVQEPLLGGPWPTLLIAQAQFYDGDNNKPVPGPALLNLARKGPDGWTFSRIEDPDSNVFHKALPYDGGILTAGAEKALLKKWTFKDGAWAQETLWAPEPWGGKFNRVRDVEVGDVNGDGKDDIVMATHDSGVIAVGQWKDGKLEVTEMDKKPDTFVHEIEIGDIDGDGVNEFFATPSGRNKASGESQPGQVVMYRWNKAAATWTRSVIDEFTGSHAKELLAVRMDPASAKKGCDFFSVVEAEAVMEGRTAKVVHPVEIRHYTYDKKANTFSHTVAATLDDKQTRFLVPGDLDGDGKKELLAAAMKTGLWVLKDNGDGTWATQNIERNSSGFEHTVAEADLDNDGKLELYVASDDQRELRSYVYNPATRLYDKTVIGPIKKGTITWNITTGSF